MEQDVAEPGQQDTGIIAGRNPVLETLERQPDRIEKVLIQQGLSGEIVARVRELAMSAGTQIQFVPGSKLDSLAGGAAHQGLVAISSPVEYLALDDLLRKIAPTYDAVEKTKPMVLILDRITDPHNFGAILRSAVAGGVSGVVVPKRNMAPISAVTIKASAGTATRIPIARVGRMQQAVEQLKERGYWVAGAAMGGDESVWDMDWDRPVALILGGEGKGVRPSLIEACDFKVSIPMNGPAESLNVSVAAGILIFAAARGRMGEATD